VRHAALSALADRSEAAGDRIRRAVTSIVESERSK
jgi:hypothetical protein